MLFCREDSTTLVFLRKKHRNMASGGVCGGGWLYVELRDGIAEG